MRASRARPELACAGQTGSRRKKTLDRLSEKFTRQIYAQKCNAVYQHIFDSYWDDGHSVYDQAA